MSALERTVCVAVVGAGAMGAGIAQVAAMAGHPVLLHDVREGAAATALGRIEAALARQVNQGRLDADRASAAINAIEVVDRLESLSRAGLVIEAIVEDLEAKRALFVALEQVVSPQTVLASNTSSVSITAIAAPLQHPQRLAGLHFFNPAPVMALVEVVSGLTTAPSACQTLLATARRWGKQPVLARSTPGFIVNRVARPFYAQGLRLLEEGVADIATLDALLRDGGGFRMGPFELMDLIGHDVNAAVTRSVFDAFAQDPRFRPSLLQQELVAAGHLGRKSGQGFYRYDAAAPVYRAQVMDPQATPLHVRVEGDLGPAQPLVAAMQGAGLTVEQVPGAGLIRVAGCQLALTDGRSATQRSAEEDLDALVLFDLALRYDVPGSLALARADQASPRALDAAAGLFQALGWSVCAVDDSPALVVMRTVALLANEAAEAVLQRVAVAADIDTAMRYGTNYPQGPLEWADALGAARVLSVVAHLHAQYGDDQFRPSPLLRRRALSGQPLTDSTPTSR